MTATAKTFCRCGFCRHYAWLEAETASLLQTQKLRPGRDEEKEEEDGFDECKCRAWSCLKLLKPEIESFACRNKFVPRSSSFCFSSARKRGGLLPEDLQKSQPAGRCRGRSSCGPADLPSVLPAPSTDMPTQISELLAGLCPPVLRRCEAWPCLDGVLHRCRSLLTGPSVLAEVETWVHAQSGGSLSECGVGQFQARDQFHETHPLHGFPGTFRRTCLNKISGDRAMSP